LKTKFMPSLLSLLSALLLQPATAALYTPANDHEVVQALPNRLDAGARAQRNELARRPQQLTLALATAQAAIGRARSHGDPRELGLAEAALAPWWGQEQAPPQVRLLRASVRQSQHDFATALRDLDKLVAQPSRLPLQVQAQAGLIRASVLQVTGQLTLARQACETLTEARFAGLGDALALPARACLAELRSLAGEPQQAAAELAALARQSPDDAWLALLRAELAQRMGDSVAAESRYREALAASSGGDIYTRGAYADYLLEQSRPAEALRLVEGADAESDALLLRRAIALKRLDSPLLKPVAETLTARFEAARLRGENYHAREQARLALEVQGQAKPALQLALQNWAQQKEPADAVLLQRAAQAAGQQAAVEPEIKRLIQAGWMDVRLGHATRNAKP
jgi:Tfp pilus assembly protein PilF